MLTVARLEIRHPSSASNRPVVAGGGSNGGTCFRHDATTGHFSVLVLDSERGHATTTTTRGMLIFPIQKPAAAAPVFSQRALMKSSRLLAHHLFRIKYIVDSIRQR